MTKISSVQYECLTSMTLEEGLNLLKDFPEDRKLMGFTIQYFDGRGRDKYANRRDPQFSRLQMYKNGMITCEECGLSGETFYVERHKNDPTPRFNINLYGKRGNREIMLTLDHILPKSLGGSDRIENAQCLCADCNAAKGNCLSLNQLVQLATHDKPLKISKSIRPAWDGLLKNHLFKTVKDVIAENKEFFRLCKLTPEQYHLTPKQLHRQKLAKISKSKRLQNKKPSQECVIA